MVADEDAEGDFTAHYFDSRAVSRVLHMSFQDGVWKWWRHATDPDDFDQRFEGTFSEDSQLDRCPELRSAAELVRSFADMMTHLRGERLTAWITEAEQAALPGISRFATGLTAAVAAAAVTAVTAGLSLPLSSGPVEGNVNRIRML